MTQMLVVHSQFHVVNIFSTEELINNTDTKKELQDFVDISKIALLFSTTSNLFSNILFTWALFCIYFKHCTIVCRAANIACFNFLKSLQERLWKLKIYFCGIREEEDDKTKPLDPFNDVYDDEDVDPFSIVVVYKHKEEEITTDPTKQKEFFSKQDERTSTPLQGERLCRCVSCFLFSFFCLLVVTYAVFFHYLYEYRVDSSDDPFAKKLEAIALAFYSFSLLRTLVSCFIFSKLMYAIQKRCEELELFVLRVNKNYLNVCQNDSDVFKYANYCWLKELKDALEQIKEAFDKMEKVIPQIKIDDNDQEGEHAENDANEIYKRGKNARINVCNAKTKIEGWKGAPEINDLKKHIKDYDIINEVMKEIKDEMKKDSNQITWDKTKQSIIFINANSAQGAAYIAKEVTNEILHGNAGTTRIAVPITESAVPIAESAVPITESAVPITESAVPIAESAVPITESAVPITESAVPIAESAVPITGGPGHMTGNEGPITDGSKERKEIALKYLKERDKHFVKTSVSTLGWFQLWFLFHWVLYMLSTFMILTLLIDAIALHVKARITHIDPGVLFDPAEIGFLFMYSLAQCFFLLYPCLRAASVTRTRARVIRHLNEQAHTFTNIPAGVMSEFIDSMRKRKFSFRLRILCAQIPFNLNIAYFSIAFGFVGVVVTLITSVKT